MFALTGSTKSIRISAGQALHEADILVLHFKLQLPSEASLAPQVPCFLAPQPLVVHCRLGVEDSTPGSGRREGPEAGLRDGGSHAAGVPLSLFPAAAGGSGARPGRRRAAGDHWGLHWP